MSSFEFIWGVCMKNKAEKRNVTLYLNGDTYDKFVDFCNKEGYAVSKKIERMIENEIGSEEDVK